MHQFFQHCKNQIIIFGTSGDAIIEYRKRPVRESLFTFCPNWISQTLQTQGLPRKSSLGGGLSGGICLAPNLSHHTTCRLDCLCRSPKMSISYSAPSTLNQDFQDHHRIFKLECHCRIRSDHLVATEISAFLPYHNIMTHISQYAS